MGKGRKTHMAQRDWCCAFRFNCRNDTKTPIFRPDSHGRGHEQPIVRAVSVSDREKPESGETVTELIDLGMDVIMLTGDNDLAARAMAEKVNIQHVISEVLPEDKADKIKSLQQQKTCWYGGGWNQ